MPPMKLRRRRSSNGRRRRVVTHEGLKWQLELFWQSHVQREMRSYGAAAVLASATEAEDGNAPPWHPDDKYTSEVLFDVINSRSSLSGPCINGQRFTHLQSIIHTNIEMEEFGPDMTAFWRRLVDEPAAFPPEFWHLFLQSSLTALGEKSRPVCVGMSWRSLITAGTMRQWRPRLEEINRDVRQFGVAIPGGVEHVGLNARTLHETGN